MAFYLEVLSGKHSGVKISVHEGLAIGRKKGDLLLDDDPKVSGLHAKIILDNKNQFVLVDQDSSNGMILSGRKVKKIAMLPGVTFRIGSTHFKVVVEEELNLNPEPPRAAPPPVPEAAPAPEEPPPPPVFKSKDLLTKGPKVEVRELQLKTWKERTQELLAAQEIPAESQAAQLGAFSPALILDFIEGIQTDQKITVGYGPRQAGFGNLDLELLDPKLPEKAFDLLPGPGSVEIRDLTGGEMLINGRPQKSHFLEEGDLISLGQTKIKVRYL